MTISISGAVSLKNEIGIQSQQFALYGTSEGEKFPIMATNILTVRKMSLFDKLDHRRIPSHIAIIMDGNGRWAKARELERAEGHKEGVNAVRRTVEAAIKASVQYLTLYAFSTENWHRPAEEVNGLMDLMVYAVARETDHLKKTE